MANKNSNTNEDLGADRDLTKKTTSQLKARLITLQESKLGKNKKILETIRNLRNQLNVLDVEALMADNAERIQNVLHGGILPIRRQIEDLEKLKIREAKEEKAKQDQYGHQVEQEKIYKDPSKDPFVETTEKDIATKTNQDPDVKKAFDEKNPNYSKIYDGKNGQINYDVWKKYIADHPEKAEVYRNTYEPLRKTFEAIRQEQLKQSGEAAEAKTIKDEPSFNDYINDPENGLHARVFKDGQESMTIEEYKAKTDPILQQMEQEFREKNPEISKKYPKPQKEEQEEEKEKGPLDKEQETYDKLKQVKKVRDVLEKEKLQKESLGSDTIQPSEPQTLETEVEPGESIDWEEPEDAEIVENQPQGAEGQPEAEAETSGQEIPEISGETAAEAEEAEAAAEGVEAAATETEAASAVETASAGEAAVGAETAAGVAEAGGAAEAGIATAGAAEAIEGGTVIAGAGAAAGAAGAGGAAVAAGAAGVSVGWIILIIIIILFLLMVILILFAGAASIFGQENNKNGLICTSPTGTTSTGGGNDISQCQLYRYNRYTSKYDTGSFTSQLIYQYFNEVANVSHVPAILLAAFARVETPGALSWTDSQVQNGSICPGSGGNVTGIFQLTRGVAGISRGLNWYNSTYNTNLTVSTLTTADYCNVKLETYMAAGVIIQKAGGTWDQARYDDPSRQQAYLWLIAQNYFGCHYFGGLYCPPFTVQMGVTCGDPNSSPHACSYGENLYQSVSHCTAATSQPIPTICVTATPIPGTPTQATASGECTARSTDLSGVVNWAKTITDVLSWSYTYDSYSNFTTTFMSSGYTAYPSSYYLCTYLVVDSYRLDGIGSSSFTRSNYAGVNPMMNYMRNGGSGFKFLDYYNGSHENALLNLHSGYAIFWSWTTYQTGYEHVGIIKSVNLNCSTGNGTLTTYESNASSKGRTLTVSGWNLVPSYLNSSGHPMYVRGFGGR